MSGQPGLAEDFFSQLQAPEIIQGEYSYGGTAGRC